MNVYLDQAKWIDLARAAHGRAGGARFRAALDAARAAVASGGARFPLSNGHYIETWRQSDDARRRRLAETMSELSRHVTIAKPPKLCDMELDDYLTRRFSLSRGLHGDAFVFGWGAAHADDWPVRLPSHEPELEHEFLASRPPKFMAAEPAGHGHRDFAEEYASGEQGLAESLRGLPTEFREFAIAASAVAEINENIAAALARAGLGPDSSLPSFQEPMTFLEGLPTRHAAFRIRVQRHRNSGVTWEVGDMVDIAYIACAVVHCDVVVTEKQWKHELERTTLLKAHGTTALSDAAALESLLI